MASLPQSKRSFDSAEADYSSPESISFAGLLCIQDQKLNSPPTHNHRIREQDQDFAFSQTRQDLTAADPSKYTPADLLISNGKLVPQALVFQPKQRPKHNQPRRKGSSPATLTASKRSGDKTDAREVSDKQKQKRNLVKEKNTTSRSGLGWKLFKSFASPCQECKAVKPAVMS
ncbi:hypothetical protein TIFTF001_019919 [Ficus carica]|uniref:Uncharacterized protein n=1 Tax=Ficus carica TaxID=3494 RepID=A0AA88AF57_FICCA|nr:hypothetical protein TIFTF001_019919 [Ficus carica]